MIETSIGGFHAVSALLKRSGPGPREILVADSRNDKRVRALRQAAARAGVPIRVVPRAELDRLSPGLHHQGVLAIIEADAQPAGETALGVLEVPPTPDQMLLALDCVQDPHNLGACLRTAEAVGVSAVMIPKDRSVGLTPVARAVSVGASERVPVVTVTNFSRSLQQLQSLGYWIVGLAGEESESLYDLKLTGPLVLVVGAEGSGLRRLTKERCDHLARIPMQGKIESLNVSVAAAVCMYEAYRQRLANQSSQSGRSRPRA